ncbi:putative WD-repeat protein [Zostera marina]|uniref:Putative WD-repeat protein n=1 Tax=Zostera marina TaxID=29655 RepID=A0A0K9NWD8_ZOSMR|nr:putative WD-repeat protein [Zostera marina]
MPRTIASECPGCPSIRALTTDEIGRIKVIEARGKISIPKMVEAWGDPDYNRHIYLASFANRERDPVLAVARKNKEVELINPLTGDVIAVKNIGEDPLGALHLFTSRRSNSRSNTLLMCTEKGKASLQSIQVCDGISANTVFLKQWDVCNAGKVECSSVNGSENYALFAGKGIEVNFWDIEKNEKIWTAKSPKSSNLGIFTPTWFTSATFLCKDDHRKFVAGTNNQQVRLYDISSQRRPVITIEFRDKIRSIAEDTDGYKIYAGTSKGELAAFDMRTGKLLGSFIGKCSGSIRSIARHPEQPVLVSCGLDRYLRFWNTNTRELLSSVFLKQNLTNVVIDPHFSGEEIAVNTVEKTMLTGQLIDGNEVEIGGESSIKTKKTKSKFKTIKHTKEELEPEHKRRKKRVAEE